MPDDAHRLPGLDLIRGAAVLGIALMNVASFALPPAAYDNPFAAGAPSLGDLAVWAIEFVFVDGKLRALFSILFGASLLLVSDRAEAAGRDPRAAHLRRIGWLLAIGLVHALLIWPGDILVMYSLCGAAASAFRDKPIGALVVAGMLCLAGQAITSIITLADLHALRAAADSNEALRPAWLATRAMIAGSAQATANAIALHRDSYGAILVDRFGEAWNVRLDQIEGAGLETLGFVLLGMAGLRCELLTGRWPRSLYRRIAFACLLAGSVAGCALVGWCAANYFDPLTLYAAALVGAAPLRPMMAIGYAALLLGLAGASALAAALRAVGRMALSAYVGTSLLFSLAFDGYGLGLFGRLSRVALLVPVTLLLIVLMIACPLWLRRFRHGPLEWLWRSLSQGSAQPMKKANEI